MLEIKQKLRKIQLQDDLKLLIEMTAFGVVCKSTAYSIQNCLLAYVQKLKNRQLPESERGANFKSYSKWEITFVHYCSTEHGAHPDAP